MGIRPVAGIRLSKRGNGYRCSCLADVPLLLGGVVVMLLPPPQATIAEAARINTTAIPKAGRHVRLRMRGASATIIKERNAATVTGRRNRRLGSKKYAGRIEFAVVDNRYRDALSGAGAEDVSVSGSVVAIEQLDFGASVLQEK